MLTPGHGRSSIASGWQLAAVAQFARTSFSAGLGIGHAVYRSANRTEASAAVELHPPGHVQPNHNTSGGSRAAPAADKGPTTPTHELVQPAVSSVTAQSQFPPS